MADVLEIKREFHTVTYAEIETIYHQHRGDMTAFNAAVRALQGFTDGEWPEDFPDFNDDALTMFLFEQGFGREHVAPHNRRFVRDDSVTHKVRR